jgi:hypothetical protein
MSSQRVKTDCCGNSDGYLIGDEPGNGRVLVEGTCPMCGAEDPLGSVDVKHRCSNCGKQIDVTRDKYWASCTLICDPCWQSFPIQEDKGEENS